MSRKCHSDNIEKQRQTAIQNGNIALECWLLGVDKYSKTKYNVLNFMNKSDDKKK